MTMDCSVNSLNDGFVVFFPLQLSAQFGRIRFPAEGLALPDNQRNVLGIELADELSDFIGLANAFLVVVVLIEGVRIYLCQFGDLFEGQ